MPSSPLSYALQSMGLRSPACPSAAPPASIVAASPAEKKRIEMFSTVSRCCLLGLAGCSYLWSVSSLNALCCTRQCALTLSMLPLLRMLAGVLHVSDGLCVPSSRRGDLRRGGVLLFSEEGVSQRETRKSRGTGQQIAHS